LLAADGPGWDPQPGFAMLRLAQGDVAATAASIRRAGAPICGCRRRSCRQTPICGGRLWWRRRSRSLSRRVISIAPDRPRTS
jgi:hypothetical protein